MNMTNIDYKECNCYLIHKIKLNEVSGTFGKYGRLLREYLKNFAPISYNDLIISEQLFPRLYEIEEMAKKKMDVLMEQLLEITPASSKKDNQMVWVQHMNMLKVIAEEMVLEELVYC